MKRYMFSVVVVIISFSSGVHCQSTATPCQSKFLSNLYSCMQTDGVNPTSLFWLTRNGTMGAKPENVTSFTIQACKAEHNLLNCTFKYIDTLDKDTTCPEVEKESIRQFFYSMFISYGDICDDPCKKQLLPNMKKCYQNAGVDPDTFLSNATLERGTLLGTTKSQVQQFCSKRTQIIGCLQAERRVCPEAPLILRDIGLDIESLHDTVGVICKHPEVYLNSTDCFSHPSASIDICRKNQSRDLIELNVLTKDTILPHNVYIERYCKIRIDHVDCDLKGWAASKRSTCGNNAVLGLRTELECSLLPDHCVKTYSSQVSVLCNTDKYKRGHRDGTNTDDDDDDDNAAASCVVSLLVLIFSLLFSI